MSTRKRILLISPQPFFEWRGSSIRVKFNALALHNLGYEVDLLTLPIGSDVPELDVNVIRTWNLFGSRKISIGPSLLKLWFDFVLLFHGFYLVIRNRYAVLHGTEEMGFLCLLLSIVSRTPCVYEKHSDSGSYEGGILKRSILWIYGLSEKLTVKFADLVICTGPGLAEQARDISEKANIACIPDIPSSINEGTEAEISAASEKMRQSDEEVLITYVGSFAEYQGIDIIFDAMPSVAENCANIRFIIIGGNDAEITHYSKILGKQGIQDRVTFLGKIDPDELPAYLSASDVLLAPRKSGINSPLKILDYFKAGSAIVATNTVANQRLLDSNCAMLCEFDAKSFSHAIVKLAKDPDERNRLGRNGHEYYRSTYNFQVFSNQLDQAYQSIVS